MNIAEDCLKYLQEKNWTELNRILSNDENCKILNSHPTFGIFQSVLVSEFEKYEESDDKGVLLVLTRIFHINQNSDSLLNLNDTCLEKIAEFLFERTPAEKYAKIIPNNEFAKKFLREESERKQKVIDNKILAANLGVRIGEKMNYYF